MRAGTRPAPTEGEMQIKREEWKVKRRGGSCTRPSSGTLQIKREEWKVKRRGGKKKRHPALHSEGC